MSRKQGTHTGENGSKLDLVLEWEAHMEDSLTNIQGELRSSLKRLKKALKESDASGYRNSELVREKEEEIEALTQENLQKDELIARLQTENARLQADVRALRKQNHKQQAQIDSLNSKFADFEKRMQLDRGQVLDRARSLLQNSSLRRASDLDEDPDPDGEHYGQTWVRPTIVRSHVRRGHWRNRPY